MQGQLISFEGIEGCGKSSLAQSLAEYFTSKKISVLKTREPGGSSLSEKIRHLILNEQMNGITETFLLEAARADHTANIIKPYLQKGYWVLCDRYIDSTIAYQGLTRKALSVELIQQLNTIACYDYIPNLTILLLCDVKTALRRAKNPNRFEQEGIEFQTHVQNAFIEWQRSTSHQRQWLVLNSYQYSLEQLTQQSIDYCERIFGHK